MPLLDPLAAVSALIIGLKAERNLWKEVRSWLSLLFSMIFSAVISFLGVMGGSLLGGLPLLNSLGAGMMASATSLLVLFLRSPLTRNLSASVPQAVVKEVHEKADQTFVEHK